MKTFSIVLCLALLAVGGTLSRDVCAPAKVTDLRDGLTGEPVPRRAPCYYSYTIEWTATGDDCDAGNATTYELYQSTSLITDTTWQAAGVKKIESASSEPNGGKHRSSFVLSCPGPTLYYAVFLIDEAGNRSPISNVISVTPRCAAPNSDGDCYE